MSENLTIKDLRWAEHWDHGGTVETTYRPVTPADLVAVLRSLPETREVTKPTDDMILAAAVSLAEASTQFQWDDLDERLQGEWRRVAGDALVAALSAVQEERE